jgi:hypothetical protein
VVANALVGQPRSNTSDNSVSASDTSTVPPANTAGNASVLGSSGRQHHRPTTRAMPPNRWLMAGHQEAGRQAD